MLCALHRLSIYSQNEDLLSCLGFILEASVSQSVLHGILSSAGQKSIL